MLRPNVQEYRAQRTAGAHEDATRGVRRSEDQKPELGDAVILNLERRRQTHVLESKFCTDLS